MQVRELIEELKRFNEDAEVITYASQAWVEELPAFTNQISRLHKSGNRNEVIIEIEEK